MKVNKACLIQQAPHLESFVESMKFDHNDTGEGLQGRSASLSKNDVHPRVLNQSNSLYSENLAQSLQYRLSDRAALHFYRTLYLLHIEKAEMFPLAGKNHCIGFAVMESEPDRVYMGVSQLRDLQEDKHSRASLKSLVEEVNVRSELVFTVVARPSNTQHATMRAIGEDISFAATPDLAKARSRCIEPGLFVALNKAGGAISPSAIHLSTFGLTLWQHNQGDIIGNTPVSCFKSQKTLERNLKYVDKSKNNR